MDISTEERRFTDCNCVCVAGMSGTCSHILALVFTLIHYQQKGLKEVPTSLSCTSLPQQWHRPRGTKIKPRPVVNMILAKAKRYATGKKRPVFTKTTKQRFYCLPLNIYMCPS
ncbi:uncharacterized protein LOC116289835 [Actinia tenebrosa]|uniref:Uncharacterized protein LOC116289835 n=1 Tax=Actinia tenebrosa TaxID=6105 RepID=A0A6P8HJ52_ACTTE|nr:uncharacterized protein LOC116289835 [Actinia tenebrosa]